MTDKAPVVRIDAAPTARRAHAEEEHRRAQARADRTAYAHRIAEGLKRTGAVVIDCQDDAQRQEARAAGRLAGRIRGASVRTTVVEGRVAVFEPDRAANPLQVRLDERRANRALDEAYRKAGPLTGPWPDETR
ncbi:hypothetical protein O4J56_05965 [Nocardiopsis sp. RSe5-2]|uniref:Uncharacterized protein n=1 Tax=Nocardiopsis endophytica TaxID=3018445 RepID=A0ABT4TZP9_9ACTN|nr:hypothetical protein [Nocardiopsis endophytica]MDA2810178.1 hypothetical protein [Nocardiopsis endophytica]